MLRFFFFSPMDFLLPPSARDNPINPPFFFFFLLLLSDYTAADAIPQQSALIELILTAGDIQCAVAGKMRLEINQPLHFLFDWK